MAISSKSQTKRHYLSQEPADDTKSNKNYYILIPYMMTNEELRKKSLLFNRKKKSPRKEYIYNEVVLLLSENKSKIINVHKITKPLPVAIKCKLVFHTVTRNILWFCSDEMT